MSLKSDKMDRRQFAGRLGATVLGGVILGAGCGKPAPAAEMKRPPNILLINADDLGMGDLSCYGSDIPTPNIDALAGQGVLFSDFYVSAPVCTPSRFSQLTGFVPQRSKHNLVSPLLPLDPNDDERGLEQGETTIAEVLKKAGYATALIGKWHLGHARERFMPNAHGFDYFYGFTPGCIDFFTHQYNGRPCFYRNSEMIEEDGYVTDLFTDETIKFLEQNKDKPFYLNLAYNAPHYGKADAPGKATNQLQAPDELVARFDGPDKDRNIYSAMVASMDDGIGKIMAALDRLGLSDNTLLIFTSDNGGDPGYGGNNGQYKGKKWDLWEGGIRIPCVMRFPGVITPGTTSSEPCSHIDFFETFAALAGVKDSLPDTEGMDIGPIMRNPQEKHEERPLFWLNGPMAAVREGDWKYVRLEEKTGEGNDTQTVLHEMLFKLPDDPTESNDLAESEPEKFAELKGLLEAWEKSLPST